MEVARQLWQSWHLSNITICGWLEMFLVSNSIIVISKVNHIWLSFLDPRDLCLPNQFSRGSWQEQSVSTYLTWCQRRNWVTSIISLTLIFNPSYVCHDLNIFWQASFVKFPLHCWTEFSQSWKDFRKKLRSHQNLRSLTDLSGANIGIHSNSRD